LLPSREFSFRGLPTLTINGINSDFAGNYQLIDKEFTGRIFVCGLSILAFHGINSDSAGNYQLIDAA
jgi:muramidase (phage lysozyme)